MNERLEKEREEKLRKEEEERLERKKVSFNLFVFDLRIFL